MTAPSKEQIAALRERLLESYLRQAWNSPSPDGVPLDSCVVNEAALTALLDDYDLRGKALEAAGCPNCCDACESATGGVCQRHQQPECTCYEASAGHQPGCPFARAAVQVSSPSEAFEGAPRRPLELRKRGGSHAD